MSGVGTYGISSLSEKVWPIGSPMTLASCSLAFSKPLAAAVACCWAVPRWTSARTTSMPATTPLWRRSPAWRKRASAVSNSAFAESARALAASDSRYMLAATSTTRSRALLYEYCAAAMLWLSARALFSAPKSRTDSVRYTRASNTLNGPTSPGTPAGSGNPNASRFTFWRDSARRAFTFGSIELSAIHRAPRACATDSSAASTPRLCSSARETASAIESGMVPGVAVPDGTPRKNALGICGAACAAEGRGSPVIATSRTGTSSTGLTTVPFSPDAARRDGYVRPPIESNKVGHRGPRDRTPACTRDRRFAPKVMLYIDLHIMYKTAL